MRLDHLYHGRSKAGLRFRLILLAFDLIIIGSYIFTSALGLERSLPALDLLLAAILLADLAARWLIAPGARDFFLRNPFHWADMVVILSLILPVVFGDFAFLRVLRALRVARSYRVLQELRADSRLFKRNEEVIQRAVSLTMPTQTSAVRFHRLGVPTRYGSRSIILPRCSTSLTGMAVPPSHHPSAPI